MSTSTNDAEEKKKDIRKNLSRDIKMSVKRHGNIVYGMERIFYLFQYPWRWLKNRADSDEVIDFSVSTKPDLQNPGGYALLSNENRDEVAKKRLRRIDLYIIVWLIIEMLMVLVIAFGLKINFTWFAIIAAVRIFDIFQVNVNILLFDPIRRKSLVKVASSVRSVLCVLINYLELIILFGIIYNFSLDKLCTNKWQDAFYFSTMTQSTIGYGDIKPFGYFKGIASVQALLGYLFTVLVIVRMVNILKPFEEIIGKSTDNISHNQ